MADQNQKYEEQMEDFIKEVFDQNFEELRLETGASIAPYVREAALQQVLLYWQYLREIAVSVTDTEVRLSLPNRETRQGREYTIEGVVDIVRDDQQTIMYDIKTHDADYVRANYGIFEQQLNVYAHIWKNLRGQSLDEAAVIATDFPEGVANALASGDEEKLAYEVERWEPIIRIEFDPHSVDETIREFSEVVDNIEQAIYSPREVEALGEQMPGTNERFVTRVCRNCDARFSCQSYRTYLKRNIGQTESDFEKHLRAESVDIQGNWKEVSLEETPSTQELRENYI